MDHLHHGAESGGSSTRVADLRDPPASIDLEPSTWNMWRSLSSIELGPAEIHRFVETRLGSARRVLEVGCGSGYLSLELARSGRSVVGLDPSADALAIALCHAHSLGLGDASGVISKGVNTAAMFEDEKE